MMERSTSSLLVCFYLPRDLSHTSILYYCYNYFPALYQYRIQVVQLHYTRSFYTGYLTSFSAHASQYFSMSIAPSTSNNASLVAMSPQLTQNFGFLPASTKDLNDEKTFSILYFTCSRLSTVLLV
jgi:hypothetical protein